MLVLDIGNTNLHFAEVKDEKIVKEFCVKGSQATKLTLRNIFSKYRGEKILICSVVPKITKICEQLDGKIYIAGKNLKVPITCRYDKNSIGMDRLVCAFAAKTKYPFARIVIDFGTAITFDFLSVNGAYEGGFILPGIGSTLRVFSGCALLPDKIVLKQSKRFSLSAKTKIPRNTVDSINRGIEDGFSSMINSLVKKYRKILNLPPNTRVVITGGEGSVILPRLNFLYTFDSRLILEGLILLEDKGL